MSSSEDQITAWFASQSNLCKDRFPIGIGDDMAQIKLGPDRCVLITTDMLLDMVHFDLRKVSLVQASYKAMAVSLSDCAAMATIPVAAVAAVALPRDFGVEQLKEIHSGIVQAGDKFNCPLVGGDITSYTSGGVFAINVTMLSRPSGSEPVRRSGAKAGDCICVTGSLGGSFQGKHLSFKPRVNEAVQIAGMVQLNAMIDISDGLSSDLSRICLQSEVGALIKAKDIPLSEAARKSEDPLKAALNDGEDFELLFTVSPDSCKKLLESWQGDLSITQIGRITATGKVMIENADGKISRLQAGGYDHLADC